MLISCIRSQSGKKKNSKVKKKISKSFPGGPVVKSPVCLIPGLGGSHMPWGSLACESELLSQCFRAPESQQKKPHCSGDRAAQLRVAPDCHS